MPARSWPPSARPRRRRSTPCPEIADAAAASGAWLHVDAAYAGSARVCPELRTPGLRARRLASSSTRTSGCSRRSTAPACSRRAPTTCARRSRSRPSTCARPPRASPNLNEYGPALGRRFRALKLWAVLRCFGRAGLQATIREHVRLAEQFEGWVRDEPGWELCAPRPYSVVCFRPEGDDARSEALLEAVNASGEAYLSHTRLNDRHVLRLADRQRRDDRGRRARGLGRAAAREPRAWRAARRRASDARSRAAAHRLRAAGRVRGRARRARSRARARRARRGRAAARRAAGTPSSRWAAP